MRAAFPDVTADCNACFSHKLELELEYEASFEKASGQLDILTGRKQKNKSSKTSVKTGSWPFTSSPPSDFPSTSSFLRKCVICGVFSSARIADQCLGCWNKGGLRPAGTPLVVKTPVKTPVSKSEQLDMEEAIALSLSLVGGSPMEEKKTRITGLPFVQAQRLCKKKEDQRAFLFVEAVTVPPLPFWCTCGWLNPRHKRAVKSGWDVCRVWCLAPNCGKERPGYWTCPNPECVKENQVEPYDVKYNGYTPDVPNAHKCVDCGRRRGGFISLIKMVLTWILSPKPTS